MLKIEHFSKSYGEKRAVEDLSIHIAPGEICGFIGHNGAGKTTTLKACTGLLDFEAGEILIDGVSIKRDPIACKQKMAYVPDNPDLYEFMTGRKYLNFISDVYGVSAEERNARLTRLVAQFGLEAAIETPISSYSHGMKQKLALIAALVHDPRLILLDEPFVGLDPLASHQLKEIMRAHCEAGGSIFFSTHVLEVAEKLCDKVAIIRGGRLVVSGTMEEVKGQGSLEEVFLELEERHD